MQSAGAVLSVTPAEVFEDTQRVKVGDQAIDVRRTGQRIELTLPDKPELRGLIRFGTPESGAIWINSECVGEFEQAAQEYVVTPVQRGRRHPSKVRKVHPVEYLIKKLIEAR